MDPALIVQRLVRIRARVRQRHTNVAAQMINSLITQLERYEGEAPNQP